MVFNVAIAGHQIGNIILAKFREDDLQRFAQKIRQHIETPSVRHAHANFLDPTFGASVQDGIQNYHERLRALKRKPFLPYIARVQEDLERFGFQQRPQQRHLNCPRRRMLMRPRLQAAPHPLANPRVLDMHEFRADRIGVNSLEAGDHFAQGHRPIVEEKFRGNAKVEV